MLTLELSDILKQQIACRVGKICYSSLCFGIFICCNNKTTYTKRHIIIQDLYS